MTERAVEEGKWRMPCLQSQSNSFTSLASLLVCKWNGKQKLNFKVNWYTLFFLTCESLKRIHYTSDSYIHKTSDLRIYLFRENVFVFSSSFEKHSLFVFLQSVTFNLGLDWCERVKWKVQRILLITTNLMVKITLKV